MSHSQGKRQQQSSNTAPTLTASMSGMYMNIPMQFGLSSFFSLINFITLFYLIMTNSIITLILRIFLSLARHLGGKQLKNSEPRISNTNISKKGAISKCGKT